MSRQDRPARPPAARRVLRTFSEMDKWGQHYFGHCEVHVFVYQRDFWGTPVNLLCTFPKVPGPTVLFPQSVKIGYFCSGPIGVDPICPQATFYSQFASQDIRLSGPSPWKVFQHYRHYLSGKGCPGHPTLGTNIVQEIIVIRIGCMSNIDVVRVPGSRTSGACEAGFHLPRKNPTGSNSQMSEFSLCEFGVSEVVGIRLGSPFQCSKPPYGLKPARAGRTRGDLELKN